MRKRGILLIITIFSLAFLFQNVRAISYAATYLTGDVNSDGKIDVSDIYIVMSDFGKRTALNNQLSDINTDGIVDIRDLAGVALLIGSSKSCLDGTLSAQCSATKPMFCLNGVLMPKCSTCGCTSLQNCASDGSCTGSLPCSPTSEICGNGIDEDCDGVDLTCACDCSGMQCGSNGCGGSCGSCSAGKVCFSGACVVMGDTYAPKEIYNDPATGYEVWRMTNDPELDLAQYYDFQTYSPNGRYLIFRSNRAAPYIYIMNANGSGEKPIGDYTSWNSRGLSFSSNNLQGRWSHNSEYYHTYKGLYVIDINKFLAGAATSSYISQVSSAYSSSFYYPMLSPDGRTLFGLSVAEDSDTGGTLKLINTDGTGYREFSMPYFGVSGSVALDVTHGWLGNDQAWYMNDDMSSYLNSQDVFNVSTGVRASATPRLEVRDPAVSDSWWGILDHMAVSPSAYFIGHGTGYIAGGGRSFKYANTKYWSQDSATRQLTTIDESIATHYSFSPDAKWLTVAADSGPNTNYILAYPVSANSQYLRLALCNINSGEDSFEPTFSPDGTKIIFNGDPREEGNSDLYTIVFAKPEPPKALNITVSATTAMIGWKPAPMHRETKQYELYRASSQTGVYELAAVVPSVITYVNISSKLSAASSTIPVESTSGFPSAGVIEISGLSTELPNELAYCTGKTATSFTGCTRGYGGSAAAEHWNQAFVWKYTGYNAYAESYVGGSWYRLRSVEWSGLKSNYSVPGSAMSACNPSCTGKICGDNGCGGSCGACQAGYLCVSGGCTASACTENDWSSSDGACQASNTFVRIWTKLSSCVGGISHTNEIIACSATRWYKGNTHTHSADSDGTGTPAYVATWYRQHGYDFVAITDHDIYADATFSHEGLSYGNFIVINGLELSEDYHMTALNINRSISGYSGLQGETTMVINNGGLPILNHPSESGFSASNVNMIINTVGLNHIEMANMVRGTTYLASDIAIWDAILSAGRLMYGVASDDSHWATNQSGGQSGIGWIVVSASSPSKANIMAAIKVGNFYSSTGINISSYTIDIPGKKISVSTTNGETIKFIGKNGVTLKSMQARQATYTVIGNETYIRADITNSAGLRGWTQPVFTSTFG